MQSLRNKKAKAPWWDGIVKIINISNENEIINIQGVYLRTNEFFEQSINIDRYNEIEFLEENDFNGDPSKFFLALLGKLIRINYEYDPFFAVGISKIDPLPHQLEAIYRYIIPRPNIRFLIADDPGAGKTIMAGLVIKELKYRKLINRILIVTPGHLVDNWLRELKDKFSENFTFINRQHLRNYWNQNVWKKDSQILTSIDFLKQEDIIETIKNENWDLIIVDEAHKMSAYQSGGDIIKTQRYRLGEILSNISIHLLFLTATPHKGDMNNFSLFLSLLEPEMFSLSKNFNVENQIANLQDEENAILIRRLKEDMINFNGKKIFPDRYPNTIKYRLSEEEYQLYERVSNYVKINFNKALDQKRKTIAFALIILQRRLSSSIRAIKKSLIRRKQKLEKIKESDFVKNYGIDELIKIEKQYQTILESDEIEEMSENERWEIEKNMEVLTMAKNIEELEYEIEELESLIELAEKIEDSGEETKLMNLWETLKGDIRDKKEKIIIFTEFRDTLEYLKEKVTNWGFEVETIHGQMDMKERIKAENRFKNEKQILIATEAAGEGINLQFCWLMVNYDIPWNPNRLEQRMGRIHRYLQTHDCYIYNCVAENTMEGKVFKRILEKLEVIRNALGNDRVFDVIGEIFSDIGLNHLIQTALNTPNGWESILERIDHMDEILVEKANKLLSSESLAQKHLDLSVLNEKLRKSDEFRLWPEYIQDYTIIALNSFGGEITSSGIYQLPRNIINLWNYDLEIKYGPLFEKFRNLTFDKNEWKLDNIKEYIAPGHPLLESLIEGCLQYFSDQLPKGAIFIDPDNEFFGLIWYFTTKVTDGFNNVICEKIISLYQRLKGEIQEISPLKIWDFIPNQKSKDIPNFKFFSEIKKLTVDDNTIRKKVDKILRKGFFEDLIEKKDKNYEIKKKAIEMNINSRISESLSKIYKYQEKIYAGENYELALNNENKNKENLIKEKSEKLEQIKKEKEITLNIPQVLGIIIILPQNKLEKWEKGIEPSYEEGMDKNEVDRAAMKAVMQLEQESERIPEDVHLTRCGYDILSKSLKTEEIRHIEVKGHSESGDIFITPNEWFMAGRFGNDFWLYIVDNALKEPKIFPIQNPAENLEYEKILETKRYIIKEKNWKEKFSK